MKELSEDSYKILESCVKLGYDVFIVADSIEGRNSNNKSVWELVDNGLATIITNKTEQMTNIIKNLESKLPNTKISVIALTEMTIKMFNNKNQGVN